MRSSENGVADEKRLSHTPAHMVAIQRRGTLHISKFFMVFALVAASALFAQDSSERQPGVASSPIPNDNDKHAKQLANRIREVTLRIRGGDSTAVCYSGLGVYYQMAGDHEHAIPCFRKAYQLDPQNEQARLELTSYQKRQARSDLTIEQVIMTDSGPDLEAEDSTSARYIKGGFGYRLGEIFAGKFSNFSLDDDGYVIPSLEEIVVPLKGPTIPGFDVVYIAVAPRTRRIYEISGINMLKGPESGLNTEELEKDIALFESKYGTSESNDKGYWTSGLRSIAITGKWQPMGVMFSNKGMKMPYLNYVKITYTDESIRYRNEIEQIRDSLKTSLESAKLSKRATAIEKYKSEMSKYDY